jgi:hypothetical protein
MQHLARSAAASISDRYLVRPQGKSTMSLGIGSQAPDFTAETAQGKINFHDWIGDS